MNSPGHTSHIDPFPHVLFVFAFIIVAALVGRRLAQKVNQPSVLGELLVGVLIGNIGCWLEYPMAVLIMHLDRLGELFKTVWSRGIPIGDAGKQIFHGTEVAPGGVVGDMILSIMATPDAVMYVIAGFGLWIFSNLGVILLLFIVGVENSLEDMMKVGRPAVLVAIAGIAAPFILGYCVTMVLIPDSSFAVKLFLSATLCATSVGITARVFRDLNITQGIEARVVLGAAVIDDIVGLLVLTAVIGIIAEGTLHWGDLGVTIGSSILFLVAMVVIGKTILPLALRVGNLLEPGRGKLLFPLSLAFVASWAAHFAGLAAIVGAFAAGLILKEAHFREYSKEERRIEEVVAPLEALFVPVFFVLMGMQVNVTAFFEKETLALALVLTVVAIIGKLVSGFLAGRGANPWIIGIGMVPRGEVGLIFASIGKSMGVLTGGIFSAIVAMVILTTLITPPAISWIVTKERALPQRAKVH